MTHTLDPEEFYRTNDMGMATFLKLEGNPCQDLQWKGDTCYWIFRVTDALLESTEAFLEGTARVEPKAYNKEYNSTKREFYESKDGSRPRR